ncbi:MAG TPA: type I glyceraldehyde-3-phosphate dehydrogenase [Phycisphaerales bacterium]|nr:type I glyceraldehyde-3-phosphate dehydrogenase [Phycisphaerales bacterium]HRQ76704.1 type I glyceraldehyde-3-phosphate dehydrogenase [Phycisphaerales bacterium]
MAIKVGINGFGRIGRLVYRAGIQQGDFEFVGVNDLVPSDNLAYLLRYDSVHGRFGETITTQDDGFTCKGQKTLCVSERDPANLPWKSLGADYVLESTGLFTGFEDAKKHLTAGAKRVLISAPTKSPDDVPTLAYKVNHTAYNPAAHTIVSNASCTTNCLAPVAKVINDEFGLEEGLMTTIHAVTATQPTQDGPSKKDWRGGRNAYMNIIPASTGAAKAVALCIPALKGKLTGMSFRVPTADVSVVDLTFKTAKSTSLNDINAAMKAAADGPMKGVLAYTEDEVVSSDFISDPHSSIFDAKAGIQLNDRFFKVVAWYDNEMGYAARCLDMLRMMAERDR